MPADAARPNINLSGGLRWSVRKKLLLGLALVCGVTFAALTVQAAQGEFLALDATVRVTLAAWQHPLLAAAMRWITALAGGPWLAPLVGLVLIVLWRAFDAQAMLLWSGHTLVSMLFFHSIRFMVARPRPLTGDNGYPSGHTVAAIAFYGLLIYVLWPRLRPFRVCRAVISGGLLLIIIGVGFSRLYLEKHWFSDVLGAYIAGGLYLIMCVWLLERRKREQRA